MSKDGQIIVVLEEKPDSGQIPLTHLGTIQRLSGRSPAPKATPIVREALRAWADNAALVQQAKTLGVCPEDSTYAGIVRHSLAQAIRFRQYQIKNQQPRQPKGATA